MKATSKLAASVRAAAGLVAAATLTISTTTFAQPPGPAGETFKVVTVAEGLRNPWSMAWLPNGDMLVTERGTGSYPGALRIIRNGQLLPEPVAGVPAVRAQGQGGMQEVAVHPNYAQNGFIYLSYAKPRNDNMEGTTALTRAKLENGRLVDAKEIFEAKAWNNAPGHFGARIAVRRPRATCSCRSATAWRACSREPRAARWIRISKATRRRGSTTIRARSCG